MKKFFGVMLLTTITFASYSQLINKIINASEVRRIETILSSDEMKGRKAFTAGAEKAAEFISSEFKKAGLQFLPGATDYQQSFTMVRTKLVDVSASFDTIKPDTKNIVAFTSSPDLNITPGSGFKVASIPAGVNFSKAVSEYRNLKENAVVFVDSSFAPNFSRLSRLNRLLFKSPSSVVFVLGNYSNTKFSINVKQEITEETSSNVVGVILGKSKKEELIVFSGHYDHLGTGKETGADTIYNGANDDAAGITAIIAMAKYYKAAKNNERTLVFAAFTAEEIGGFGSQYFSSQLDPNKVVAMFNIEMIGTESKWGKNSAYITGFEKSDMGTILQKNLKGSNFKFYPDPYTQQNLFYRSDNATLARVGVPAHTISTSKMDDEPNYHKLSDEVGTLDIPNMTEIIKSIIISSKTIVSGKDTPSRVNTEGLN